MVKFITRPACPICGETRANVLVDVTLSESPIAAYLKKYYGGTVPEPLTGRYTLVLCPRCDSLYQRDILDDAGMDLLYEQWIRAEGSFQKKFAAPPAVRIGYARQCLQVIKAVNKPPHEIRVLDFGMGWGAWLLMAKAFGMLTEGLELSPSRVTYAQANGLKVVTPQEIQPATYHFINAEQVFEHLADPLTVLKSCFLWLQPKGFLRIAVPDGGKIKQQIKKGLWSISEMPTMPLEHINTFTPSSLRYFARQNGFQVIHPPLVLPAFGLNTVEIRQVLGVLAMDAASRLGLYRTTVVWLQKP